MTSQSVPAQAGKINFAGMVGAKRRRMRSGGNVSTLTNNVPKNDTDFDPIDDDDDDDDDDDEKMAQTSKCKGATTIPIFLKSKSPLPDQVVLTLLNNYLNGTEGSFLRSNVTILLHDNKETYKMIDTCDPSIASW
jgi:hypothetical protein